MPPPGRYAGDVRFAFGTWKIEILAGFASAVFLLGIAALMVIGSIERLFSPRPIHYREALLIALVGLAVNSSALAFWAPPIIMMSRRTHIASPRSSTYTGYSCALTVITHNPALTATRVRGWLAQHRELVHATIEVHRCD